MLLNLFRKRPALKLRADIIDTEDNRSLKTEVGDLIPVSGVGDMGAINLDKCIHQQQTQTSLRKNSQNCRECKAHVSGLIAITEF